METYRGIWNNQPSLLGGPHSLGTLIEWKRYQQLTTDICNFRPHSLGTLIEWKQPFKF